jgi:tetratricopeptide (TPR) repeat protein
MFILWELFFMFYRMLVTLFIFVGAINSYGMDENRYAKALEFRDGKVEGYTAEESTNEAEILFKELAEENNAKAAHNYALIQYKKGKFELAYEWFLKAGLEASKRNAENLLKEKKIREPLDLIVGSTRQNISCGPLVDAIYKIKAVDLSHRTTFGKNATTMDLSPCAIKDAKHIVGDATTFDFSKYKIRQVLIEKLSTVNHNEVSSQDLNFLQKNYLGSGITNIAKAMECGTVMQIEWLPYSGLYGLDLKDLQRCVGNNPFHCFLNANVVLQSIFILGGDKKNIDILPEELHDPTLKMVEEVRSHLNFYHEQGAGESIEELIQTLYFEAKIILDMMVFNKDVFLNYQAGSQNVIELKKAYNKAFFNIFSSEYIGKQVTLQDPMGTKKKGFIYNAPGFLQGTFLNFVIQDIAAQQNKSFVMTYLESIGFKNISIEKRSNPHNGRQNVWMIEMTKK